jgi:hypothetical protein
MYLVQVCLTEIRPCVIIHGMKIVKLNSRFRNRRDYGHTIALRFDTWNTQAAQYEQAAHELLGSQYSGNLMYPYWRGHFGVASGHTPQKPYWISFRDSAHLTVVMLRVDQKG